ncbi:MAG: hypothetical protein R6V03_01435 [Kiritimatiellia bacterium]
MMTKNDVKTGEFCAETAPAGGWTGASADKSPYRPLFAPEKPHKLLNRIVQRWKSHL